MLPESSDTSKFDRQLRKGYQSISTVPGMGSIASRILSDHHVRNLSDLARLDPYDDRFTKLGEDFPRWVLHARNIIADEIIKNVEVRNDVIIVSTYKVYDREATLKSVLGRLGVYYIYVDSEAIEKGDEYEISIRLKPEQYAFAQAQWNEYKANASLLQELKKQKLLSSRWKTLKDIDNELGKELAGMKDLLLYSKLCFRAQLVKGMNILAIWKANSINRTYARLFVQNFIPRARVILLGDDENSRLGEVMLSCKEGSLLFVDDWEKAKSEERRILMEAMAYPKMQNEEQWSKRGSIVFNVWSGSELKLNYDMLGLLDIAFVMPDRDQQSRLPKLPESLKINSTELERLVNSSAEREIKDAVSFQYSAPKNRIHSSMKGFSPDFKNTIHMFAMAEAKVNGHVKVEESDIKEASFLVEEALDSLSYLEVKGKKSRK